MGAGTGIIARVVGDELLVDVVQAVPVGAALGEELRDAGVHVVVGTADIVIPAVALEGELQAALLPDVVERDGRQKRRVGALAHLVYIGQGVGAVAGQQAGLGIYQIDVGQAQDVGREPVAHALGTHAEGGEVVGSAAEQVLGVVGTGLAAPLLVGGVLIRAGASVIVVVIEAVQVETACIRPEVRILVAEHHDGRRAAVILVDAVLRVDVGGYAEGILQVHARALPIAPDVAELAEAAHGHVALDGVLRGPDAGRRRPLPGDEVLAGLLEYGRGEAEDVGVLRGQAAAGIVDDVLGVAGGLAEVLLVERAGDAGLGQVDLGEQALGGIVVDPVVFADVGVFRKQLHGLLEGHHDVLVDVGLLDLELVVVAGFLDDLGVVVDDRHVAEGAHEQEVGHGLPGEGFADGFALRRLGGAAGGVADVVDHGVALGVDGPERVGHVLEVLVGAVDREGGVGVLALVDVAAHGFGSVDVETDDVVPRRVVQVVHGLLHLGIVLVVVGRRVAVFGRAVQELAAGDCRRADGGCYEESLDNGFHLVVLHVRK